ncbi:MAG: 4-(cytidine 5'-diphospho)-2-C-methyl-D-erythritol kinase, partial [Synechococcaceae bacterium WB6_1B_055]|nr:4-(cytidine 5'-diphospho)-2-C-methyl-D-erythritol kinase [Synechococcaceae bacterium WB6_1B_055]
MLHKKAPAKLNLHLEVLGIRPDGFHELVMVMQTVDLFDHISVSAEVTGVVSLSCSDPCLGVDESNLIVKAAVALKSHCKRPDLGAQLHLQKNIPIGAGLAGGSSDAATALLLLNDFWQIGLSMAELEQIAAKLGSDVPFCLKGGSQCCFGRGERLQALADLPSLGVLLIKDPSAQVSTPWAYGQCKQMRGDFYLTNEQDFEQRREQLRQGPLLQWFKGTKKTPMPMLRNDLQAVVAPAVPSVSKGISLLKEAPARLGNRPNKLGPEPLMAAASKP